MNKDVKKVVEILNNGGVIIFPTDTAFGIGCRIDNEDSVKKLFEIRKRPLFLPTPVLVSGIEMARDYLLDIPDEVEEKLINKFWPGALTIVLPAKIDKVPSLVMGGEKNLGVRMPNSELILDIIEKVGVPILGPSANFHGDKTPYKFSDLNQELVSKVDMVLNGKVSREKASTVIDCSNNPWQVLRFGAVDINIK